MKDKKRILIVDDAEELCQLLRAYFAGCDCYIDVAYDGLKAKYLLECGKYDYIFFDCNMPELSGVELIKVIKEKNPRARKIMISGYDLIDENFAAELGIDLFLRKPVSMQTMKEIMEDVQEDFSS